MSPAWLYFCLYLVGGVPSRGRICWVFIVLTGCLVCGLFVLVLWARDDGSGILLVVPCSQCSSFGCLGLVIWPWFSGFEVSFRFLEFAPLLLCLDLDSLALVDWLGHPVRGFSLGVLSLSLSVFCVLSWVSCGCPFGSALMVLVCRSWTSCFGLVVLGGWPFSFCFRFLGLGLVIVTPTCSGRLTVAPWSGLSDFGSLGWLSGLGLACLIFLGLAFRVVLLDSWVAIGLGSLRVCWLRSFKYRAWSWVLWSWIPDCKPTSPGSW